MRNGTQLTLSQAVLSVLPTATMVVDRVGLIQYANAAARHLLDKASPDSERTSIADWLPKNGNPAQSLAIISASSNWLPLRLTHPGGTLHFRARGLRDPAQGDPLVVLSAVPEGTGSFEELSRKIRRLNEQIAIYQRTELRLRDSISLSRLLKRELVHRVKNNLAIISAMLRSKARKAESHAVSAALYDAESRIRSIAVVHDILDLSNQTDQVDLRELFDQLLEHIRSSICPDHLRIESEMCDAHAHIDLAVPLALLVNELVTNAIKHGYTGRDSGTIKVDFSPASLGYRLKVSDDGIGMPSDGAQGIRIPRVIAAFASQSGTSVDCEVRNGTHWSMIIAIADMIGRPPPEQMIERARPGER